MIVERRSLTENMVVCQKGEIRLDDDQTTEAPVAQGVARPLPVKVSQPRERLGQAEAARWAGAQLVRYADDFVVLARSQGERLRTSIEGFIEGELGLEINCRK